MLLTLFGIITESKLLQSEKACSLMLVTLLGIVTELILLHSKKAYLPILVTPYSILTVLMEELEEYHGAYLLLQFSMSPEPLMVSTPLLFNSHVRLAPHVPLAANTVPALAASARIKRKIFFIHFNFGLIVCYPL